VIEPEPTVPNEPEPTVPLEPEPTAPIEPEPTPPTGPEPTPPVAPEPERPIDPIETSARGEREAPALVEPPAAERAEYAPPVLPDLESAHADDVAGLREPATAGEAAGASTGDASTSGVTGGVSTSSTTEDVSTGPTVGVPEESRPQIVYVSEPIRPKDKSNRGMGTLLALASGVVFLLLYGAVAGLIIVLNTEDDPLGSFVSFVSHPSFWLPVVVFTVAYILFVLIVNRASWWAHVLGGLLVAALTYLSFIGGALLGLPAWNFTLEQVTAFIRPVWYSPFALIAFILAREVPIWIGAVISSRGRQLKTRNAEAREEFDREQARVRSEYERSYSTAP
jgi:hypothetical protein